LSEGDEEKTAADHARLVRIYADPAVNMLDEAAEHYDKAIILTSDVRQKELYQLQYARTLILGKRFDAARRLCTQLAQTASDKMLVRDAEALLRWIDKKQQSQEQQTPEQGAQQ
jgi:hypothetical protein